MSVSQCGERMEGWEGKATAISNLWVVYIAELQTALIFKNLNHFLQNVLSLLAFYVYVVFTNKVLPVNAAKSCIIQTLWFGCCSSPILSLITSHTLYSLLLDLYTTLFPHSYTYITTYILLLVPYYQKSSITSPILLHIPPPLYY